MNGLLTGVTRASARAMARRAIGSIIASSVDHDHIGVPADAADFLAQHRTAGHLPVDLTRDRQRGGQSARCAITVLQHAWKGLLAAIEIVAREKR